MKFCDEKTPLVKDWAYYIKWVVEDQILLSAQKQTQNRLETQIRLRKRVGTSFVAGSRTTAAAHSVENRDFANALSLRNRIGPEFRGIGPI